MEMRYFQMGAVNVPDEVAERFLRQATLLVSYVSSADKLCVCTCVCVCVFACCDYFQSFMLSRSVFLLSWGEGHIETCSLKVYTYGSKSRCYLDSPEV